MKKSLIFIFGITTILLYIRFYFLFIKIGKEHSKNDKNKKVIDLLLIKLIAYGVMVGISFLTMYFIGLPMVG